ncbi:hypothetical protein [Leadbettera azotonutricia]|uniref:hypothetical protein n=1 Tax=Leadbettera azotonutricia TaxID=150829 RepID=UPI000A02A2DB|nr:hypothetical protein [Leadbettera azotonutricia]
MVGITPGQEGTVDKFAVIVTIDTQEGKRKDVGERRKPLKSPFLSFIEQGEELNPAGRDISGGQGEIKLSRIPFAAVMDGVNLKKARFSIIPGVMGSDLNMLFEQIPRFRPAYSPEGQLFSVFFQCPVNSRRTYGQEFGLDFRSDMKGLPYGDKGHLGA